MSAVTQLKRKAAKRPAPRTVTVTVDAGDFAGWTATARADFPVSVLIDLESGSITRTIEAMEKLIIEHNMPDADGEIAATLADVDPYEGVLEVLGLVMEEIGKLPNR